MVGVEATMPSDARGMLDPAAALEGEVVATRLQKYMQLVQIRRNVM
jgi:hypothetical protein